MSKQRPHPHRQVGRPPMAAGLRIKRSLAALRRRLFCHRNIIIISEHKTEHLPISSRLQFALLIGVMGFVIAASYSTGNYMAAQNALREKERKIATASLENRRIESEFALLKRDMIKMVDDESKHKDLGEYAQFVLNQYKNGEIDESSVDLKQLGASTGNSAVFQRVAYLEQKVAELKETHELVIDSIRSAAKGKLSQLETIIKTTGLNMPALEKKAEQKQAKEQNESADAPRGGPFVPAEDELLSSYDESLYRDLKRMSVLADVTDSLPLAIPMAQYKLTSGFGMRVDPFRHTLARHTGQDFSGPIGSRVYATSDGVVKQAGPDGAYGNAIIIDHQYGVSTLYGHLSRFMVTKGQHISKGQQIGIQGSTGRSTGPHLHYEVMYNGVKLNPSHFLKAGANVRQIQNSSKL